MKKQAKKDIGLVALDMDGTLFNNRGEISQKDQEVLRRACEEGVAVAVATGRAYSELPIELLTSVGIHYGITGNGGAIYQLPDKRKLFSACIDTELLLDILEKLLELEVYFDIYVDGLVYCPRKVLPIVERMDMPKAIQQQVFGTRIVVDDILEFVKENDAKAEKVTVNFALLEDGTYLDREKTARLLDTYPQFQYLCGGYHNLEFTMRGITKGKGLHFLADVLGLQIQQTMACGDSENDLAMLQEAGWSVAMANGMDAVKEICDYITYSNEEHGVAHAIETFVLKG